MRISKNNKTVYAMMILNYKKYIKGDVAKNITMLRYLNLFIKENLITDEEWKNISQALQKYWENDVRAMIAVEKYIKEEFIVKLTK